MEQPPVTEQDPDTEQAQATEQAPATEQVPSTEQAPVTEQVSATQQTPASAQHPAPGAPPDIWDENFPPPDETYLSLEQQNNIGIWAIQVSHETNTYRDYPRVGEAPRHSIWSNAHEQAVVDLINEVRNDPCRAARVAVLSWVCRHNPDGAW